MFSCRVNIRFHIFLDPTEPGREAFLGLLQLKFEKLQNCLRVFSGSKVQYYMISSKIGHVITRTFLAETIVNN